MSKFSIEEQVMSFPDQIREGLKADFTNQGKAETICFLGFGHSAVAGQVVADYSDFSSKPVYILTDDRIPGWIGEGSDAILTSYGGETKEIISAYKTLKSRGCRVHCFSSGGMLKALCDKNGDHHFMLPRGMTCRTVTGYEIGLFGAMLRDMGFGDFTEKLMKALDTLDSYVSGLSEKTVSDLVDKIQDRVPAIYAPTQMIASAKRWKDAIGNDCCALGFYGEMPEFDHNELVGWSDPNDHAPTLRIIVLRPKTGEQLFDFIMNSVVKVLESYGREVVVVDFDDETILESELCAIYLGDMVSLELKRRG